MLRPAKFGASSSRRRSRRDYRVELGDLRGRKTRCRRASRGHDSALREEGAPQLGIGSECFQLETARPLIDSTRHALTVELPQTAIQLHVDPVRTSQVIAHALNNAAKYTDAGGLIRMTAVSRDRDLILTVTDNAIAANRTRWCFQAHRTWRSR